MKDAHRVISYAVLPFSIRLFRKFLPVKVRVAKNQPRKIYCMNRTVHVSNDVAGENDACAVFFFSVNVHYYSRDGQLVDCILKHIIKNLYCSDSEHTAYFSFVLTPALEIIIKKRFASNFFILKWYPVFFFLYFKEKLTK